MQNNHMNPLEQGAPWLANYGDVPFHLEYPNVSIADAVLKTAEKEKDFPAISFMGKTFSYTVLVEKINQAAAGFVALGVKKGDMVTICMPNVPQAVFCMYALNRIGAVASMIHPLSAVSEIIYYLREVKSDYLLTLDQFYSKVAEAEKTYPVKKVIITSAADELGAVKSAAFKLMNANKKTRRMLPLSSGKILSGTEKKSILQNISFTCRRMKRLSYCFRAEQRVSQRAFSSAE